MTKKTQFIKDMKSADIINDIFVVKFKKPVDQYKNGFKFELRLGDSSKEIMFKMWGPPDEDVVKKVFDSIKTDDFVRVQGKISEWNNNLEMSSNDLAGIQVLSLDDVNLSDFVQKSERNIEEMYAKLLKYTESVENLDLKKFLEALLSDPQFVTAFKQSPAAMYKHHGWIGGLLEHTLSVMTICVDALKVHTNLDRDLVIVGSLIHDIGKMEEFTVSSSIKVSTEGMLLGHISIGFSKLSKILDSLDINGILKLKLKHIVLSHHGNLEYGSPKLPAFPEALLIHYADELDARVHLMQKIKEGANTEDDYIYTKDFGNIFLR